MTETHPPQLPDTETPYGVLKRFHYIDGVIEACNPETVLDIGCGTGALLTHPLAASHRRTHFFGVDSDAASIEWAKRTYSLPNLEFSADLDDYRDRRFQLIIASEVLEHVEEPLDFLNQIRRSLAAGGKVILTVPNGYGPFEWSVLAETALRLSGLYKFAIALTRLIRNRRPLFPVAENVSAETLAVSPHINFFSFGVLARIFSAGGFHITSFQSRTLLCGPGFDQIIQGVGLQNWNA
ncbi:MAG TPA: class I SAM-dependent methyltransferase, partial [Rhodospirillales bacterium]|nr:class I SAM-dependent methyltransferase [Rhodospirillales bacterium]